MLSRSGLYVTLITLLATGINCQRVAIAHLVANEISGSITFTETDDGLRVTGSITGLSAGEYGFHIHELGDVTTCLTTGAHFNPDGVNHGGRDHDVRHVGDFGNVQFVDVNRNGVATVDFTDHVATLRGRNNILGRALVLHEGTDDLGLGGHEDSLTTGNAGGRVACGVIGIVSPGEPWENSAVTTAPSLLLMIAAFMYSFIKF
ncbi:uncharacterized protein LOC134796122 [Cydia splendana]|uniref:uncharacterized protein LOC134796122 n=1 Tax=Cydia splendana TaxID=1100963 RepID=UPI00300D7DF6